jgi:hypothetical protein
MPPKPASKFFSTHITLLLCAYTVHYRLVVPVPLSTSWIPVMSCRLCPPPCPVGLSFFDASLLPSGPRSPQLDLSKREKANVLCLHNGDHNYSYVMPWPRSVRHKRTSLSVQIARLLSTILSATPQINHRHQTPDSLPPPRLPISSTPVPQGRALQHVFSRVHQCGMRRLRDGIFPLQSEEHGLREMQRRPLQRADQVRHRNARWHLRLMHHGRETGRTRSQARPYRRRGAEKFMLRWLLIELLLPALTVMGRTKRFLLTTPPPPPPPHPVGRSTQPPASRSRIFLGVCNQKVSCCCAVTKSPPSSPLPQLSYHFSLSPILYREWLLYL